MAKEMMIVFVYDTARCRKEEDDPAEAVVYFHPAWVSPTQRLALAGQLMGVNQFLTTSFSPPSTISLQGGKFVMKKFGQFMLAVGTDRNIQDWILLRRMNTLESILKFFHCDLETVSASLNNDRNRLTEKLYQMFETYLPILQYSAGLFSSIPNMKLPKSASNIFLEAIQVLQYCQGTNGIMAGAMFYNNKVVATQLSADLTKQLVIADPYRIKVPAERISTEFHLPIGVQLLRVYIQRSQLLELTRVANTERAHSSHLDLTKKVPFKKSLSKSGIKDLPVSGMKRDTSRIFTVPEEGELESTQCSIVPPVFQPSAVYVPPVKRKQETKVDHPKYTNPPTPSVCSTPLKDINRVLHDTAVSICSTAEEIDRKNAEKGKEELKENIDDIPDVVKEALRYKRINKLRNAPPKERQIRYKESDKRSLSTSDLEESIRKYSNRVTLRYYCLGLPKLNDDLCTDYGPDSIKPKHRKQFFNTITDPYYPVFRYDGLPVSRSLYDNYIASQYQEVTDESEESVKSPMTNSYKSLHTANVINDASGISEGSVEASKDSSFLDQKVKAPLDFRLENKVKQETYRRSMSLPLKSLNAPEDDDRRKSTSECDSVFNLPPRRKLDGLQLTPLMSKLSLLADERTSGFCSRETTPSEFRDFSGFSAGTNQLIKSKLEAVSKEAGSDGEDDLDEDWVTSAEEDSCLQKVELFLCGHQNMVLVLLMEDGTGNNPDLIHSLWETCVNTLGSLELRLQQTLEPQPATDNKELYSVLCVDPQWDTVHRSGLWGVTELEIISSLHDKFSRSCNLTDIVVRTEDTVVYGNQSGKVEVFYQQAVAPNAVGGLPTPADLMGVVPLKAKRRLERDHGIILL
ncbi:uncharacterized protein LOC105696959 isoform X2 [Orussus abietinus]|uniref:uncharacterized protein LOC105696959 isoform X2 n=1 Tax=Orussus abietinus TaxID=222816 RepID=UPI000626841D|nr:uncharacterized protein LOC105696959 isoform X2 [Orussus abietinus]